MSTSELSTCIDSCAIPTVDKVYKGDCLKVLKRLSPEMTDLIYLDPPFLTQKQHRLSPRDRARSFSFSDIWQSSAHYADFLHPRVKACAQSLKKTGSIFFHCDRNAVHIARAILDDIFGPEHFRSEIIWNYRRWSSGVRSLQPSHQNILYYSKSTTYTFNQTFTEYSPATNVDQILQRRGRDDAGKSTYRRDENLQVQSNGPKRGVRLGDVWDIPYLNPKAKERVGYPTQKPILLLERIILLASRPGDCVLDPFCGSGTTLVAAKLNDRKYIGIDSSADACGLARRRLARPFKSDSKLLHCGREAYRGGQESLLTLLGGCDFVPVQRNAGIDAIVNVSYEPGVILVRIQRESESIDQTANMLIRASRGKNALRLVVIRTQPATSHKERLSPEVWVIDSPAIVLQSWQSHH